MHDGAPTPDLAGVRILLVEDDPDTRELLAELMSLSGARVKSAGSAAEALDALASERPDVLVSDIGLPDLDGYGLISKVRRGDADGSARVPAIALTAYAQPDDGMRALQAGFDLHVTKPVDEPLLFGAIAQLLGRPR